MKSKVKEQIYIHRVHLMLLVLPAMILTAGSCGNQQKQDEGISGSDTSAAYLYTEKEKAIHAFEMSIEEMTEQIAALEKQADAAEQSIRETYREQVRQLQSDVSSAEAKVNELKQSSRSAWEELREGVESALQDLNRALQEAEEEFGETS